MMDYYTSDDSSCDSEIRSMRSQLYEYGLGEAEREQLSKEEMANLLMALNNSKSTAEEDLIKQKTEVAGQACMKRRYRSVKDRRMPWSLLPVELTAAQRARTLTVYIRRLAINRYRVARQSPRFSPWEAARELAAGPVRATRSGRHAPLYTDADDDSNDLDFVLTPPKRRKTTNDQNTL